ncbi:MAG: FHA domain-containing protein [Myxococcales bacterium]|nr:FHA domain-containing protein [Polyangiaceae bacterium]MDW8249686.1 FHA domain-containing protein [Myxococcales bacterium]
MRCPTCEHENPHHAPRCEACGAALSSAGGASPVHPGRRVTSFEPTPFLPFAPVPPPASAVAATEPAASAFVPPAGSSPTVCSIGAPVPRVPPPAPFVPSSLPPPGASLPAGTLPVEGRRTVAEPAPVLPSAPTSAVAPTPPAPLSAFPGMLASPVSSSVSMAGGLPPSILAHRPAVGQIEPTRLAQSPEVGAPQLRGALFEYRAKGHPGFIHTLRDGKNVLGRDPAVCDVVLEDDRTSKQHAFLFIRDEDASFLDISTNGSIVDGRPVRSSEVKLSSSSVIQVGGLRLIFVFLPKRLIDGL